VAEIPDVMEAESRMNTYDRNWIAATLVVLTFFLNPAAHATEGGASLYLPGTYNDFSAAVFGPSGVYFRNDFLPLSWNDFESTDRRPNF
jgi:hypothetical protein